MDGFFRRLCGWFRCNWRVSDRDEYVLLKSGEDVEMADLEEFLRDNFNNMGVGPSDLAALSRDSDVMRHLLSLLPVYRQCMSRYVFLDKLLSGQCLPHMRPAAEVECEKSKRVLQTLDVLMLKLIIGEFSIAEGDTLEKLLDKFSADQSTLCEIGKILRLINMDRQESQVLMTGDVGYQNATDEEIVQRMQSMPIILEEPGEVEGCVHPEGHIVTAGGEARSERCPIPPLESVSAISQT